MPLECLLEGSSGRLGGSGGPLRGYWGASRGPLEGLLGPPWGRLGGFSGALGVILKGRARDVSSYSPFRASHEPLRGFLWPSSGSLGPSGGSFGPSWAFLRGFMGRLGTILGGPFGRLGRREGEKGECINSFHFFKELRGVGLWGPSRRSAGNTLGPDRRLLDSRLLRCLGGLRPQEPCRAPMCTTRVWAAMIAQITYAQMGPGHHCGTLANRSATSPNGGCATTVAQSPRVAPAAAPLYARAIARDQWIVGADTLL